MESKPVFGIDLGTTYSCIAYVDEHGRPIVAPNSENTLTTPSVVYFELGNNIVVGQIDKDTAEVYPDLIVQTVKRHMGDANWLRSFHGRDYRRQDVSALILRKVVGDAEQVLGQTIEDVVITCPAYFGNVEKEATRQAGTIAGLNVRFVVPEPMAAAFAYGVEALEGQTIMVYDLGGGTFDGTLLRVPGTILSTAGDLNLGGKDWDDDLVTFFTQKFQEVTGVSPDDLFSDLQIWQELTNEAEKCKMALSSANSYKLRVKSGLHNVAIEVTRAEFEQLTRHRLDRTIEETKILFERGREQGVCFAIDPKTRTSDARWPACPFFMHLIINAKWVERSPHNSFPRLKGSHDTLRRELFESYRLATSKKAQRRPAQGQSQNTKNDGDLTTKT